MAFCLWLSIASCSARWRHDQVIIDILMFVTLRVDLVSLTLVPPH